jgi:superfamily II DNA or RNA helicase
VQVASVQTLIARDHDADGATLMVLDECHHFAAPEFQTAIPAGVYIVGLTATPERGDGVGLHTIMDRLVVVSQIKPLIDAGYLAPVDVICPAERLGTRSIAQRPVDAYRQHGVGQFICYSSTIDAATKHAQEFKDEGLRVALITGKTYADVREKALEDFQAGALDGLVNVNVLTEGTDLPCATTAIVARDIGPVSLLMQIAGRVMRKHPGKDRARLLDLHGCTHVHGHPSEDRVYSLDGTGMRRVEGADQSYCRVCGNMITPGNPCDDCGTAPPKPKPMRVTGDKLVKFDGMRKQPPNVRVENLRKWIAIAQAKGWKKGQPMYKFYAMYGHWPSRAMMEAAYRR